MRKQEKKCPNCSGLIECKVVHNDWGAPSYNGMCRECNAVFKGRETPELAEGREVAHSVIDGTPVKDMHPLDNRITAFSGDTQLGILRELQHGKDGYLNKKKGSTE